MKYAACLDTSYDPNTGVCSEIIFVDLPTVLPALSVEDASLIASAIVATWAVGFAFKLIRRYMSR